MVISAHETGIACLALNLQGTRLATSSEKVRGVLLLMFYVSCDNVFMYGRVQLHHSTNVHVQTCVIIYKLPLSTLHAITPFTSHHHLPLHLTPSPFPPPHTITFPSTSHHHLSLHLTPSPSSPPHTVTFPSTSHHHLSLHLTPSPSSPPHTITFPFTSHHHHLLHLTPSPFPSPHTITFPSTSQHHLPLHLTPSPFPPPHTITFPSTPPLSPFPPPHHCCVVFIHSILSTTHVFISICYRVP